jgi:uncharacterized OB-fold protein
MSDRVVSARPVPVADELSRPFWDAAARHELRVQRCAGCARLCHPPRAYCPSCGSRRPAQWASVTGPLRLRSWTTVHVDVLPGTHPPFLVGEAGIDGEDTVTITAQVTSPPDGRLRLHQEVAVVFVDLESPAGEPFTLLRFNPVEGA